MRYRRSELVEIMSIVSETVEIIIYHYKTNAEANAAGSSAGENGFGIRSKASQREIWSSDETKNDLK